MNQLYEKKCDCRSYDDPSDHRSALLKMELPEYEDQQYGGTSYTVFRAMRFIAYIVIVILLGYSLWRIHVIESTLMANDRFNNISRIINMENSGHRRVSRSVKEGSTFDPNSFTFGEKELSRGTMLTAKSENVPLKKKRPQNKEEFENLVNSLFDKIHTMHNDSDRGHFDRNMRELFQAWFPVFDALLPHELMGDQEITSKKRAADKTSEESSEEKKQRLARAADKTSEESSEEKKQRVARAADKTSEESSEEKKQRLARAADKTSEESSEEKKQRVARAADKTSKESSEEKKQRLSRAADKTSEESSEEKKKKQRVVRSAEESGDRSSQESSEEQLVKESNRITEEQKHSLGKKQDKASENKPKSSEESSEEKKNQREKREADSSDSSSFSDSSEEKKPKWTYYKHKTSAERFQEYDRQLPNYNRRRIVFTRNNKNNEESKSSTSSESSESSEKPKNKDNLINLVYHVVTQSPNYPNVGLNEISSDPVKNK